MIFGLFKASSRYAPDLYQYTLNHWRFGFSGVASTWRHIVEAPTRFVFCSRAPILRTGNDLRSASETDFDLSKLLSESENDFAAIEFVQHKDDFTLRVSSARITRARMYFIVKPDGLLISDDLRELIPFSSMQIDAASAYSILKYGDTPEYLTIVDNIFCVPVGTYLHITQRDINSILSENSITGDRFRSFYKLAFPMNGGDIASTHDVLKRLFGFLATRDVVIPISGGVDSTLINALINESKHDRYPAYHLNFGPGDQEIEFAKRAVNGTKADLIVNTMSSSDLVPAFEYAVSKLVQPIGEGSAVFMAHVFRTLEIRDHEILDGTLADGAYGSRDYNLKAFKPSKRPKWIAQLAERIATEVKFRNARLGERFYPRDSVMPDVHIQFMHMYLGPFANTIFPNAQQYSAALLFWWQWYYSYLDDAAQKQQPARFAVFKMLSYACKNNTAKTKDLSFPANAATYPFTWKSILENQGHYTWEQKRAHGIPKQPLKRILSEYLPSDFVYRRKVGLNAGEALTEWMMQPSNQHFFFELLQSSSLLEFFISRGARKRVLKLLRTGRLSRELQNLVLSFAQMQSWMNRYDVGLPK